MENKFFSFFYFYRNLNWILNIEKNFFVVNKIQTFLYINIIIINRLYYLYYLNYLFNYLQMVWKRNRDISMLHR